MSLIPPATLHRLAVPSLLATLAVVAFGAGYATRAIGEPAALAPAAASDPCALPAGVHLEALAPADRALMARRHVACRDRMTGRITEAEYRTAVAAIDDAWRRPVEPPQPSWAAHVIGFSSQYSEDSWSAHQILGAPNVYPAMGDRAEAWASLTADGGPEWIEVGFDQPRPISQVQIFETFNPGAIAKVELITVSGRRILAASGRQDIGGKLGARRVIDVQCTSEPVASVRVELDSRGVSGWNELDAIGVLPCQ
jgi:hypothetical protein